MSRESTEYMELKTDNGMLVVNERIDSKQLCAEITPHSFTLEIILDNPMELHHVTVEILDGNDHSPAFPNHEINLDISELATPGVCFLLRSTDDPDVGINTLQNYILSPNDHFILKQLSCLDRVKSPEMVLQKPIENLQLSLILTAVNGGNPQGSSDMKFNVFVLNVNDNTPVFNQTVYTVMIAENSPKGTYLTTVNASDADSGVNGLVSYSFANLNGNISDIFAFNKSTGVIILKGELDYEKAKKYEINVEAKGQGGLENSAKVIVDLIDVNDNAPTITIMFFSSPVFEDVPLATTIMILSIKDLDAGENGLVTCSVNPLTPFKLQSSIRNYYTLVTDAALDRECVAQYNITITASDLGSPSLSSRNILTIRVSDVNDSPPRFVENAYTTHFIENNSPGVSIFRLSAHDADSNQNARISYFLEETTVGGSSVYSYVSVNADSGEVYASVFF